MSDIMEQQPEEAEHEEESLLKDDKIQNEFKETGDQTTEDTVVTVREVDVKSMNQSTDSKTVEVEDVDVIGDISDTHDDKCALLDEDIEDRLDDYTRSLHALNECSDMVMSAPPHRKSWGRYRQAAKGMLPIRMEKTPKGELPVNQAGIFSLMTFAWMTSIMWNIYRQGITAIKDLRVGRTEMAEPNSDRLERIWFEEVKKRGHEKCSFLRACIVFIGTRMAIMLIWLVLTILLQFASPAFFVYQLLKYVNSGDVQVSVGIGMVCVITVTEVLRSMFFSLSWCNSYATGIRLRAATQSLLFKKILKLRGLEDKTVGELVNLLSNDGQRIFEAVVIGPLMLPGPLILILGQIYLYTLIGPWSFLTMGIYLLFYPFMLYIAKLTNYFRRKCIRITDRRVRLMNELLSCIKLIKMYAWEKSFADAIAGIRAEERAMLEKGAYVQSLSTAISPMVPIMSAVFTFLGFVLTGNELTPVVAFTTLAVLNSMRFVIGVLPFATKSIADAKVSFKRYKDILLMDEMKPHPWTIFNDKYMVVINKATFTWDKQPSSLNGTNSVNASFKSKSGEDCSAGKSGFVDVPALQDINVMVEKGKLLGVCGSVGCGKSSLLSAILGRMHHVSGKIAVGGSIGYVSQQAWIINSTVKDNILFGEDLEPERYAAVVQACSLESDFSDFADGDKTEIGERGINLSGGQKQRISLARAVYSNKDILLLDDPLSAVDIHVGSHIFSQCIMGLLKGKTVIFVTHQLQYLSQCDSVMFVKDGRVLDMGTHTQLMESDTEYSSLIKTFYTQDKEQEKANIETAAVSPTANLRSPLQKQWSQDRPYLIRQRTFSQGSHKGPSRDPLRQMSYMSQESIDGEIPETEGDPQGKLIVAEEKQEGAVGWSTYGGYMKSGGGYVMSCFVLLVFILAIGAQTFSNWWLSHWLGQGSGNTTVTIGNNSIISSSISHHPNLTFYTQIYGGSVGIMIILTFIRALVFMKVTLRASSTMHNAVFRNILTSSMQFFDTTPVGRIINRFSSDIDEIDVRLPSTSEMFLQNLLLITFSVAIIIYVSPWFALCLIPLAVFFVGLNIIFTSGIRELMRMNAITKSPILSHVTASVQGISTIYAYGKGEQFLKKFHYLMDTNSGYFYLFFCSNRWLAVQLDIISACVVFVTGLCVVLTYHTMTPAMAGLALSNAIQMVGLFQFTIRQAVEVESKFVAVQRLLHYSKQQDGISEAPSIIPDHRPPKEWPQHGEIKFHKYKMRYRSNLPLALKGVGFTIKPKEKIGIVGRSGSGKSSLGVALFRLCEPAEGTIYIDGVDITTIGLEDLRSRLAIIPQDPVLFVGTVRYNLDPFGKYNDAELWDALEKCHIKDTISSLELKLDHLVVENGENFSVGERQLLCLARALLRHSKILMLDEATAAIDTETDALVQKTIQEVFADCTMLIIAHRLNTVLSCSRIMVIEDGKVVEYGKPSDLTASSKSKFKAMLDAVDKQQLSNKSQ